MNDPESRNSIVDKIAKDPASRALHYGRSMRRPYKNITATPKHVILNEGFAQ